MSHITYEYIGLGLHTRFARVRSVSCRLYLLCVSFVLLRVSFVGLFSRFARVRSVSCRLCLLWVSFVLVRVSFVGLFCSFEGLFCGSLFALRACQKRLFCSFVQLFWRSLFAFRAYQKLLLSFVCLVRLFCSFEGLFCGSLFALRACQKCLLPLVSFVCFFWPFENLFCLLCGSLSRVSLVSCLLPHFWHAHLPLSHITVWCDWHWLIFMCHHVCYDSHSFMCDGTDLRVWSCVIMCDITDIHSRVIRPIDSCVIMCDMTDTRSRVIWLISMCDHVWHDWYSCVCDHTWISIDFLLW